MTVHKKILYIGVLALILVNTASIFAEEDNSFDSDIMIFYQTKNYRAAPELLQRFFDEMGTLDDEETWYYPMMYFFGNIFTDDDSYTRLKEMYKTGDLDKRIFIGTMIACTHTKKNKQVLQEIIALEPNDKLKEFFTTIETEAADFEPLEGKIEAPTDLDILWSIFFATGDTLPVQKIASTLAWDDIFKAKILKFKPKNKKEKTQLADCLSAFDISYKKGKISSLTGDCDIDILEKYKDNIDAFQSLIKLLDISEDELYAAATKYAAFWSLAANAVAHPIVLDTCVKIADDNSLSESTLMKFVVTKSVIPQ